MSSARIGAPGIGGRARSARANPPKAFFVDVSEQLNTVIFAGKLIARVGLATKKPAEFIILRISRDTRPSRPSWLRRSVTRS